MAKSFDGSNSFQRTKRFNSQVRASRINQRNPKMQEKKKKSNMEKMMLHLLTCIKQSISFIKYINHFL